MNARSGEDERSDAHLVAGVLDGDREAFASVYDRYGDRLYDFANSMLRQREEAEDAVADSFVIVAERISQLRDPDHLRPWLYAIVRSECLRWLRARKRIAFGGEERLVEMADESMATPEAQAEKSALRDLVWDASAGLADRDRAMLDLHLRQGLEGAELGEAMGVSAANSYVMLNRLRAQVERSLGALLIARLGRDECDELDGMLVDWDGRFSPLVRKRVARHVDKCDVCADRRRRIVSPWALLAGVPLVAAPLSLRDRVVNDTQLVAYSGPIGGTRLGSRRRKAAAAAGAAAVVIAGTVFLWPGGADDDSASTPTAASEQATPTPGPAATESPSPTPTDERVPAGTLTVSTQLVDLGRERTSAAVRLTNTGGESVSYRVTTSTPWLAVSPGSGAVAAGEGGSVGVTATRSNLPEGAASGTVTISWDRGRVPVTVRLVEERTPVVGRPSTGRSTCGQGGRTVIVSSTASDEAGLDSVVLKWTGPSGPGSAAMSASGSGWTAPMGPFPVGGPVTMSVTATDKRGNSTTGPSTTASVDPCPQ